MFSVQNMPVEVENLRGRELWSVEVADYEMCRD